VAAVRGIGELPQTFRARRDVRGIVERAIPSRRLARIVNPGRRWAPPCERRDGSLAPRGDLRTEEGAKARESRGVPSRWRTTLPGVFSTQPASPHREASRWTNGRNPTPCTTPRAVISIASMPHAVRRHGRGRPRTPRSPTAPFRRSPRTAPRAAPTARCCTFRCRRGPRRGGSSPARSRAAASSERVGQVQVVEGPGGCAAPGQFVGGHPHDRPGGTARRRRRPGRPVLPLDQVRRVAPATPPSTNSTPSASPREESSRTTWTRSPRRKEGYSRRR